MSPSDRMKAGIGQSLRVLRLELGWSQTDLHRRTGLLRGEISSIETGQNLGSSWRVRELLARGFGVPLTVLNSYFESKLTLEEIAARIRSSVGAGPLAETASGPAPRADADYAAALPNLHLAVRLVAKSFGFNEEPVRKVALRLAMAQEDPTFDLDTLEWTELLKGAVKKLRSETQLNPLRIPSLAAAIRLLAQENPKDEPQIKEIAARLASEHEDARLPKTVEWFRMLDEAFKRERNTPGPRTEKRQRARKAPRS